MQNSRRERPCQTSSLNVVIDDLRKGGGGNDDTPVNKGDFIWFSRKDENYISWLQRNNYFKEE